MQSLKNRAYDKEIELYVIEYLLENAEATLYNTAKYLTDINPEIKFIIEIEVYGKKIKLDYFTMRPIEVEEAVCVLINNFTNTVLQ